MQTANKRCLSVSCQFDAIQFGSFGCCRPRLSRCTKETIGWTKESHIEPQEETRFPCTGKGPLWFLFCTDYINIVRTV